MADQKGSQILDKNNKYDRQLRLWGDHGQSALEAARVCLINATATGTEILKNVILPGIGSFTIIDAARVQGDDIGNNFFLTPDTLGQSRAKVATELLGELNDDVTGNFVEEDIETLLQANPNFFSTFSLVVATNLHEKALLQLAAVLWERNVPLLVCRCYGFIGYLRLVVKEHTIVESHPDSTIEDLRLDRPFPAFIDFCDSLDMDSMTKKDHSHTPWLVVVYKYLQQWNKTHDGQMPKNYKEKNELKDMIRKGIRLNEEGLAEDEENFTEAINHVNSALVSTAIPREVEELFEDPCCTQLTAESKTFWVLCRALKDFVHNEGQGCLPLRGTIPDMTSDSERYIQLQTTYRQQASEDVAIVRNKVHALLQDIGRACCTVSDDEIRTVCRNAAFLRVMRCRSLADEYNADIINKQELSGRLENEDGDDALFYILLRAADRFDEEYSRYPGLDNDHVEPDIAKLRVCVNKLLHDWGLSGSVKDDYIHEMCRYGASEIHSVASFMGGVAAQEVIKVLTGQFVPINNTFLYNGSLQTSTTFSM